LQTNMPEVYVGHQAIERALDFLRQEGHRRVTLVTDDNLYEILGRKVETALKEAGFETRLIVLRGQVLADERSIVQVLLPRDEGERIYLSVGSGTLTDVTRFASHRSGCRFIAMPTAPSMDGYASDGSSLTIGGYKQTIFSRPPIGIFADLKTLTEAPRPMIASGFGDMFGKFTATADWKLAQVLWDEPYNEEIARRSRAAVENCAAQARVFGQDWEANIHALMSGLLEEGLCMLAVSSSRPASGSEHQFSHFWEMKMLREGRPAVFHGTKVGIASVMTAGYYRLIRGLDRAELKARLDAARLPDWEAEIAGIRQVYGPVAEDVIASQKAYMQMTPEGFEAYKHRILERWDEVQAIAAAVPEPETITALLRQVGAPAAPAEVGLTDEDVRQALRYALYVRSAYTVLRLCQALDLILQPA